MSFKSLITYLRASWKARQAPLLHGEEIREWARDAVHFSRELFDPLPDPEWPYMLVNGTDSLSTCVRGKGRYVIKISPLLETPERRCQVVGHEFYHRATLERDGLRREAWVDEMVAYVFSEWFLDRQRIPQHAKRLSEHYLRFVKPVDVDALRGYKRSFQIERVYREQPFYPEGFMSGVARVGLALNHLVKRDAMCRLALADTWEDWLESLPGDIRYPVQSILGLSTDGLVLTRSTRVHKGYGYALKAVGRNEEAIEQYQEALGFRPNDIDANYQIGFSLRAVGRLDDARRAWEEAAHADPASANPAQGVGSIYYGQKEYTRAARWFAEAARRDPSRARAFYFWGKCCLALNDPDGARRAWERVAEVGDEAHADEVRRFLGGENAAEGGETGAES